MNRIVTSLPFAALLLAACTVKAPLEPEFLASLPASFERQAPGANTLVDWHLDLLPDGTYQLRTGYPQEPPPNQFDQVGKWRYDGLAGRLTLEQEGTPPLLFAVAPGLSELRKLDDEGGPVESSATNPPLKRLAAAAPIEPVLSPALRGTYWKLVELDGAPVGPFGDRRREPHLVFATDEERVSGSSGCNRFTGGFTIDAAKLSFAPLAATKMFCFEGAELENRLFAALSTVEGYRLAGSTLELLLGAGERAALLEAAEPPVVDAAPAEPQ